jgi:outer membrane protein assembly factor BamB
MQPSAGGITAENVGSLQLLWSYKSAAEYDTAGPIEAGGVVYAADYAGNVVALNAQTGAVEWTKALGAEVKMTPALLDGRLFVATYVDTTPASTSTFFALDPHTGNTLWSRTIAGGVHGSPVAVGGSVYVPVSIGDPPYCHPGGVFAFNEATGAPAFDWQTVPNSLSGGGAIWASVTYDGKRLLFGSGNTCSVSPTTANAVVAISTLTNLLWSDQTANALTDDDVGGSVAEIGGTAYASAKNGSTYAIDPSSGAIKWSHSYGAPDGQGGFSTPVMSGSTLVVSGGFPGDPYKANPSITQYGMLFGVDPSSGTVRWEQQAVSPYWAPPATTSDLVIETDDANVEDIDSATGATIWSTPINSVSRAQPAIADGEVFAVDASGRVYAFALPTDANAALRSKFSGVLAGLPAHHIVPITWKRTPVYCKI